MKLKSNTDPNYKEMVEHQNKELDYEQEDKYRANDVPITSLIDKSKAALQYISDYGIKLPKTSEQITKEQLQIIHDNPDILKDTGIDITAELKGLIDTKYVDGHYMDDFEQITHDLHNIYLRKNHDYGNSFHEQFQEFGLTSAAIRLNDKMLRFKKLIKSESEVKDESIEDTLKDLANYAILTLIELKNK